MTSAAGQRPCDRLYCLDLDRGLESASERLDFAAYF